MPIRQPPQTKRHTTGSAAEILKLRKELHEERLARLKAEAEIQELRKELRAERLALKKAEKRCNELEQRVEQLLRRVDDLSKQNEILLRGQRQTDAFLQNKIRQLEKDVADRDEKLDLANKQLEWFRKHTFDKRSEKDIPEEENENYGVYIENNHVVLRAIGKGAALPG